VIKLDGWLKHCHLLISISEQNAGLATQVVLGSRVVSYCEHGHADLVACFSLLCSAPLGLDLHAQLAGNTHVMLLMPVEPSKSKVISKVMLAAVFTKSRSDSVILKLMQRYNCSCYTLQ